MIRVLRALGTEPTPARPGPGAVPEALLKALELTIARRVDGLLAGDHRSALLGRGTELAQVRPYVPGDDVRLIDWNVTARTTQPHVRVHLAERVLVTWIVLDTSPSMAFGTADRRKADVALGVALAIGHAATVRGNRVGLVGFGGETERVLPPRQGRAGLVGLLLGLKDGEDPDRNGGPGHTLADALKRLAGAARQRSLVVVVSDFRGPRDWRKSAAAARRTARGRRRRGARSPRAAARARRDALARRPRERRPAAGRHERREAPRAVRRLRPPTSARRSRGSSPAAGVAHVDALDRPRLAPRPGDLRAAEAPVSFSAPTLAPLAARDPAPRRRSTSTPAGAAAAPPRGSRTRRSSRTSSRTRRAGAGTCRPRSSSPSLAVLVVGIARPHVVRDVTRNEATIVLAIDTSRSMAATDVEPSRFERRAQRRQAFLETVPEEYAVGIVSFATSADPVLPPTLDREAARVALARAPARIGHGARHRRHARRRRRARTAGGGGAAAQQGERSPAAVLVLSDGAQTSGEVRPLPAAQRARRLGVPVSAVAVGTGEAVVEVPLPGGLKQRVVVPPEPQTLRLIARTTGGTFLAVARSRLARRRLRASSGRGWRSDRKRVEVTSAFAAGGALLLLLGGALSSHWFRRAL